jgi:hypothetical protein
VTILRGIISVSKRARQKFDLERFRLRKIDDIEVKEKYQIEISKRFAALESVDKTLTLITLGKILEKISIPQPKIS